MCSSIRGLLKRPACPHLKRLSDGVDLVQSLPDIEGIHVEFVASGESDPTDSPSDLAIKVELYTQVASFRFCGQHHGLVFASRRTVVTEACQHHI